MTVGSRGTPSAPTMTTSYIGSWSYKEWSGADGKYSAEDILQWNTYTCEQDRVVVYEPRLQFRCILPGGGTETFSHATNYWRSYPGIPSIPTSKINRALAKILDQVKDHSFNLAVSSSQLHLTADMVVSNLGKLGRAIQGIRHGDFAMAAHQLSAQPRVSQAKPSDIAGRWLELQYGWLPLLQDVHGAMEAYHAVTKGPRWFSAYSSAREEFVVDFGTIAGSLCGASIPGFRSVRYLFRQREPLSTLRSLGLLDPLSVVWENVPYSFVVDWFLPIGQYLSNLNQIPFLVGDWLVSEALKVQGPLDIKWRGTSNDYPFCGYHGGAHRYQQLSILPKVSRQAGYYQRHSLSSPPKVPFPSFDDGGLTGHNRRIGNAIALAYQRFLG